MGTDLRERVAQRAAGQAQPGAEVEPAKPKTVVDLVRDMEAQFAMAMPKGAEAAQLVRDVITMISQNPKLRECVPATVLGGAMTMAQLGLRPGVLGHGWMIPFWDKNHDNGVGENGRPLPRGAMKAQLVIGYKGYLELISRSGRVSGVGAHAVHERDEFVLGYVDGRREFTHRVDWWSDRGKLLGWYAAGQEQGADAVTVTDPMSVAQMEEHRDKFAMAKKNGQVIGPWADHFDSMAKKTMLLRLASLLPKETDLARAIEADGKVRVDYTPPGIDRHERVIEGEVESDSFEHDGGTEGGEPDAPPPDDAPKALARQMNRIHGLLAKRGITSDDAVRSAIVDITGRDIASRTELLRDEADQVIAHLEKLAASEAQS